MSDLDDAVYLFLVDDKRREQAALELAQLRAMEKENATAEKMYKLAQDNLADAQAIIADLRRQLEVACHITPEDMEDGKAGFDWAVLGKVADLEADNAALRKVVERVANFKKWLPSKMPDEEFATINAGVIRAASTCLEAHPAQNEDDEIYRPAPSHGP